MENNSNLVSSQVIAGFPGYMICEDGSVLSEWRFQGHGRGVPPTWYRSGEWKPLARAKDKRGRFSVRLRKEEGVYRRIMVSQLIQAAWPPILALVTT